MTFVLPISACYLLLAIKKPSWALAVLLMLLPIYQIRLTAFGLPTTLLEIFILCFLLGLAVNRPNLKPLTKLGKINWAIGLFLVAAGLAVWISPEKTKALGEFKAFFVEPILLFYAAVLLFQEKINLKLSLQTLFISSGVISLFGLVQWLTFSGLPIQYWGTGVEPERITSVFAYPNALALFLAPLFGLFLVLFYKQYQLFKHEWLEVLGLLLMAAALILTFSRGAWVAVIVTAAVFFLKHQKVRVVLAGLIVILLAIVAIAPIRNRVLSSVTDASSGAHLDLMKVGINKVLAEPFLGNGLYGFRTTLEQAHFQGEILNYPHNIFLNFWLETGLLGLLAFGLIIFAVGEQNQKHRSVIALAASTFLLIVILHGFVDVPYFKNDLAILFWVALSLFYAKPPAPDPV